MPGTETPSSRSDFEIVVTNVNQPPDLATPLARTVNEGDPITIALSSSDADGDNITFSSANLPLGAQLIPDTGVFRWTPRFDQHGSYQIDFTASDGQGSTTRTANIEVLNVNGPVKIERLDKISILEGQPLGVRIGVFDADYPDAIPLSLIDNLIVEVETSRARSARHPDAFGVTDRSILCRRLETPDLDPGSQSVRHVPHRLHRLRRRGRNRHAEERSGHAGNRSPQQQWKSGY